MQSNTFAANIKTIVTSVGVAVLLLSTAKQIIHSIYPIPSCDDYVTTTYDEDKKLYNEQFKAYKKSIKPIDSKHSLLNMAAALLFIAAGVFTPLASVSIGLIAAGILEALTTIIIDWDTLERMPMILFLLAALGLLIFSLYRSDKKQ
jgi:hypothetical protein